MLKIKISKLLKNNFTFCFKENIDFFKESAPRPEPGRPSDRAWPILQGNNFLKEVISLKNGPGSVARSAWLWAGGRFLKEINVFLKTKSKIVFKQFTNFNF